MGHTAMSKCLLLLATVVALANAGTGQFKCPGSKAFVHAKTEMTITFQDSCVDVQGVIKARISGSTSGAWVDPHNKGHYVLKSSSDNAMALQHITSGKNHGGPYTDEVLLTFTSSGAGCSVDACSESQVTSVLDFSTNFCNIHDLYCSDAGCNPIAGGNKLTYTEKIIENSSKQHSTSDCYKSSAAVAEVQQLLSDGLPNDGAAAKEKRLLTTEDHWIGIVETAKATPAWCKKLPLHALKSAPPCAALAQALVDTVNEMDPSTQRTIKMPQSQGTWSVSGAVETLLTDLCNDFCPPCVKDVVNSSENCVTAVEKCSAAVSECISAVEEDGWNPYADVMCVVDGVHCFNPLKSCYNDLKAAKNSC